MGVDPRGDEGTGPPSKYGVDETLMSMSAKFLLVMCICGMVWYGMV